jgi:hypothetical protein
MLVVDHHTFSFTQVLDQWLLVMALVFTLSLSSLVELRSNYREHVVDSVEYNQWLVFVFMSNLEGRQFRTIGIYLAYEIIRWFLWALRQLVEYIMGMMFSLPKWSATASKDFHFLSLGDLVDVGFPFLANPRALSSHGDRSFICSVLELFAISDTSSMSLLVDCYELTRLRTSLLKYGICSVYSSHRRALVGVVFNYWPSGVFIRIITPMPTWLRKHYFTGRRFNMYVRF